MIFTFFTPKILLETLSIIFIIYLEFPSTEFQIAEINQTM